MENGEKCNREFQATSNTSTLNRHLKTIHRCQEIKTSSIAKSESQNDFELLVLKMIISGAFAYCFLNNKYFKELISKHTLFSSPSVHDIRKREKIFYEFKINEIKEIISKIITFAITTDGWTCRPLKKILFL